MLTASLTMRGIALSPDPDDLILGAPNLGVSHKIVKSQQFLSPHSQHNINTPGIEGKYTLKTHFSIKI